MSNDVADSAFNHYPTIATDPKLAEQLAKCQQLPTIWVDSEIALYELIDEIDASDTVALDTEFIRRDTYAAILALIQVNTGKAIYLVDAPKLDLTEFWEALAELPEMLWYAAGEDLAIFYHKFDQILTNVVDVQIGVMYLIGRNAGYKEAMQTFVGLPLDKGESRSNWLARPLRTEQEKYAADDVRYLPLLWGAVKQQLLAHNLYDFVLEDSLHYAREIYDHHKRDDSAVYLDLVSPMYSPQQMYFLQLLTEWREGLARTLNRPPSFIVSRQAVREIIVMLPRTMKELSSTTINRGTLRDYGKVILEFSETARQTAAADCPDYPLAYSSKDRPFQPQIDAAIEIYRTKNPVPPNVLLRSRWMDEIMAAVLQYEGMLPADFVFNSINLNGYRRAWIEEALLPIFYAHRAHIEQAMVPFALREHKIEDTAESSG